jgi:transposase
MKQPLTTQHLPNDIDALKALVIASQSDLNAQSQQLAQKDQHIKTLSTEVSRLSELVIFFKLRQFYKSSEKHPDQAELFNEPEVEDDSTVEKTILEESSCDSRKEKSNAGRKPLPKNLPRERIEHALPVGETCECGAVFKEIGEEISEQLEIIPAKVIVRQLVRKKYACPCCDGSLKLAPMPKQPIPKSIAGPGLLAYITTAKYQDALPLYRQENAFKRLGVALSRQTMANWMVKTAELCQPLYNLMQDHLLDSGYVHMDETRVQVLNEADKPSESQSYMWIRKTGDSDKPVVLFDYAPDRKAQTANDLLPDFKGFLQTDDYVGYHKIGATQQITHLGCWAHARRKFMDAKKVMPKNKTGKADMAINLIQKLYRIEQQSKDQPPDKRFETRQADSIPVLDQLKAWLDKSLNNTVPKSKLGEALGYLAKNWEKLNVYTTDGRLNIDNNPVENAIRPFAIGRKNWMFSQSVKSAKASAMLYSLIETAKANGLEPQAYLTHLFRDLPNCNTLEQFEQLLPWNHTAS